MAKQTAKRQPNEKLENAVKKIIDSLSDKEKRQDQIIPLTREIIRGCALAIKSIHEDELAEAGKKIIQVEAQVAHLKAIDAGLENVSMQSYQEYVEAKSLHAIMQRKEIPTYEELKIAPTAWLAGLADCVGELRRALQLSLSHEKRGDANYFFEKMNEIYENLMLVKFSSSLVGPLKHKQDVIRSQIEQARSEMLRSS